MRFPAEKSYIIPGGMGGLGKWSCVYIVICTKITELNLSTKILEVNLFAFAYRFGLCCLMTSGLSKDIRCHV